MTYLPTVGLEIHAELKTKTKLFCNSKNDPDETRPNTNICPICMGHPGTLPTLNKEAVRHIVRVGLALGGEIADVTYFDRKNYFYPDIPKGYQISQYQHPLVRGGSLTGVAVTRVHLEEDTARSQHTKDASLIDFNRASVPLMELVTEPVIKGAKEAVRFARELQLLLRYLGVGEANMEKGEMRIEANISVRSNQQPITDNQQLGTKVEVKNLNSFRAVERAIAYETQRQSELLERGKKVVQETRGWDEAKQQTVPQRLKEESHDYRYFPEPDLTVLRILELFDLKELNAVLPELPWEKRARLTDEYGLSQDMAEVLVGNLRLRPFYELVFTMLGEKSEDVRLAANYITSDLLNLINTHPGNDWHNGSGAPAAFVELITMVRAGEISSRGAKDILAVVFAEGSTPRAIAEEKGLLQQSDIGTLEDIVERVVTGNPGAVTQYRAGKEQVVQYLVGQGMKATRGAANPEVLRRLLVERLK